MRELSNDEIAGFIDTRNESLYSRLNSNNHFKIVGCSRYSCSFEHKQDPIICVSTDNPLSGSFAHELLHLDLFRRTGLFYFGKNLSDSLFLENKSLLCVANESLNYLHHFSFFNDFIQMGYSNEDFLESGLEKRFSLEQLKGYNINSYLFFSAAINILCHSTIGIDYTEEVNYLQEQDSILVQSLNRYIILWDSLVNGKEVSCTRIQLSFGTPFLNFIQSYIKVPSHNQ